MTIFLKISEISQIFWASNINIFAALRAQAPHFLSLLPTSSTYVTFADSRLKSDAIYEWPLKVIHVCKMSKFLMKRYLEIYCHFNVLETLRSNVGLKLY